jgi:hypothetical protein
VKTKDRSKIHGTVTKKLKEIQEKLDKFEELAKTLGKDFGAYTNK